jgi:hypothetical protein
MGMAHPGCEAACAELKGDFDALDARMIEELNKQLR